MRNYFVFDNLDSRDFGVYISGGGTFNAPPRRYREYNVPGRNGTLTIDEGAFEEAEVTYPAFIGNGFKTNIEAFRSAIMSKVGYVRMTDSYHSDEFYRAKYMAGLEADVIPSLSGANFELTFRRDPRRFLVSGESVATYPSGIPNSKNLLPYPYNNTTKTTYGVTWTDNGDGTITMSGTRTSTSSKTFNITASTSTLTLPVGTYILSGCPAGGGSSTYRITLSKAANGGSTYSNVGYDTGEGLEFTVTSATDLYRVVLYWYQENANGYIWKPMIRKSTDPAGYVPCYNGATSIYNPTLYASKPLIRVTGYGTLTLGNDTITVASGQTYVDIDSEIMDCYNGTTNKNSKVTFSSGEFPTLKPGVTGVSYSGSITKVEITPRWYRL